MLRLPAVALAAVLLAACGGDDSRSAATTLDVTATTPVPPTAPDRTTVATAPGACPAASVPTGATEVSTAAGDFDGDRRPDEVRTYRHTGDYFVQIGLAAGGGDTLRVRTEFGAGMTAIGGFDVDGDGDDEAWLSFAGPVRVAGLVAFDGCRLAEVTLDGAPARFAINRTFLGGSGVACSADAGSGARISVFEGSSGDGTNFTVQRKGLRLDGAALSQVAQDTFTEGAGTTRFGFDCGSLRF